MTLENCPRGKESLQQEETTIGFVDDKRGEKLLREHVQHQI